MSEPLQGSDRKTTYVLPTDRKGDQCRVIAAEEITAIWLDIPVGFLLEFFELACEQKRFGRIHRVERRRTVVYKSQKLVDEVVFLLHQSSLDMKCHWRLEWVTIIIRQDL